MQIQIPIFYGEFSLESHGIKIVSYRIVSIYGNSPDQQISIIWSAWLSVCDIGDTNGVYCIMYSDHIGWNHGWNPWPGCSDYSQPDSGSDWPLAPNICDLVQREHPKIRVE